MAITLLHHWDFHENTGATIADVVGGNNGTALVGSLFDPSTGTGPDGTNLTWVAGRGSGYAMSCNGQTGSDFDYVYTEDQVAAGGLGAFAISIWFKQAALYGGVIIGMMGTQKWSSTPTHGNSLFIRSSSGTFYLSFGSSLANLISYELSGSDISDNDWHHLVAAWCSGTGRIFIDKTQVATGSISEHTAAGWWRLFGSQAPSGTTTNNTIAAELTDARIYTGCITNCEIDAIYNGFDPSICNQPANAMMFSCNT